MTRLRLEARSPAGAAPKKTWMAGTSPAMRNYGFRIELIPPLIAGAGFYAPSSAMICSRITNFCGLPVAVIGNSVTKRMCRGTLWWAICP